MEHLKDGLSQLQRHLGELETAARKLPNQNFADIIKSARGRLAQAAEHPDLDAVHEQLRAGHDERDDGQKPLPFDPSAGNTDAQTYG